jgi:hypothetical protein
MMGYIIYQVHILYVCRMKALNITVLKDSSFSYVEAVFLFLK